MLTEAALWQARANEMRWVCHRYEWGNEAACTLNFVSRGMRSFLGVMTELFDEGLPGLSIGSLQWWG